jgi:hypothetical protein
LATRFITVEVRVVWLDSRRIETKRFVRENPYNMSHHAHAVERGLSVKQHNVSVHQMPVYDIAKK